MFKKEKIKLVVATVLVIVFSMPFFMINRIQADPFLQIEEKLKGISKEEKEVLQNLFILMQEIEGMEREAEKISQDIDKVDKEIKDLEVTIAKEEENYEKKKEGLKQVLKSYQRMGPSSYLEIILDSDSLNDFLSRINILQDITRNTGELLNIIEASKEKLSTEKAKLDDKLVLIKEKQEQLKESLAKKIQLKKDKEEYLASLKGNREYYQEQLDNLKQVWDKLQQTFSGAAKEFSRIIEEEDLPSDALKISFGFLSIKGTIEEKTFNDIVKEHSQLPNMEFSFLPNKMKIELPEKNLFLEGTLIILGDSALKFQPKEGSFYGMPLEPWAIEELFKEGNLVINLKPVLYGNTLHSIEIKNGCLELSSIPQYWKEN